MSRASLGTSYQWGEVGSDGRHLHQVGSVAGMAHWTGSQPARSH